MMIPACFSSALKVLTSGGGTRAIVDVARRTHPQARRDRTKTRDYWRRATAEQLASAEARLKQIDLSAWKREE